MRWDGLQKHYDSNIYKLGGRERKIYRAWHGGMIESRSRRCHYPRLLACSDDDEDGIQSKPKCSQISSVNEWDWYGIVNIVLDLVSLATANWLLTVHVCHVCTCNSVSLLGVNNADWDRRKPGFMYSGKSEACHVATLEMYSGGCGISGVSAPAVQISLFFVTCRSVQPFIYAAEVRNVTDRLIFFFFKPRLAHNLRWK